MIDVRTFPPLKTMIENHVKALLADHQSAIWETPHHPEAYQGNAEKILNGLIAAGIITMSRSCPPGGIPTRSVSRGPNFKVWRGEHEE
jgi:hypothetical protein